MESLGVRFHWNTRLDGLVLGSGPSRRVSAVRTSAGELPCDAVFLALGHSARDSVRRLHDQGVRVAAKPFQLGVRIEHPQPLIDRGRYGDGPDAAALGPAYYNLVCKAGAGVPSSYSFCMCPGGTIVASTNVPGLLCTNGMSNSRHSSPWASAALVTTFGPHEYGSGPFAGVEFQETLERRFFAAGGGDYTAPAQGADDFLAQRSTTKPRHSTYTFGTCAGRIDHVVAVRGPPMPSPAPCGSTSVGFPTSVPRRACWSDWSRAVRVRSACPGVVTPSWPTTSTTCTPSAKEPATRAGS